MDTLGRALIGRLRLAAKEAGIPLWLNTPLHSLITDDTVPWSAFRPSAPAR